MESPPVATTSPLQGWEHLIPTLTDALNEDKTCVNPHRGQTSTAYSGFVRPIKNDQHGGFDIHIYFNKHVAYETKFASDLFSRIRLEFPELRIHRPVMEPTGPHPMPMFEINLLTPLEFGAFFTWLVVNHGPLSVLVHPNTGDNLKDHTELATWIGPKLDLNLGLFNTMAEAFAKLMVFKEQQEGEGFE